MADECRIDLDGITEQPEIQLADNQGTTSDNDQEDEDTEFLDEIRRAMKKRIEDRKNDHNKIGWIPLFLLQNDISDLHKNFRPKGLPIGLVHAFDFWSTQKELKVQLAATFVLKAKTSLEHLLNKIDESRSSIAECFEKEYVEKFSHDPREMARNLLLDGCAVLQFIDSYVHNKLEEFGLDKHQSRVIREDLFLLRNQIPFLVLKLLIKSTPLRCHYLWERNINIFLHLNNMMAPVDDLLIRWNGINFPSSTEDCINKNKHFRDLLHKLITSSDDDDHDIKVPRSTEDYISKNYHLLGLLHELITSSDDDDDDDDHDDHDHDHDHHHHHDLGLLHELIKSSDDHHDHNNQLGNKLQRCTRYVASFGIKIPCHNNSSQARLLDKPFYRNVQELKSAGIECKPTTGLDSISFSSKCFNITGDLKLPTLMVDEWTERKLINLIAYEMGSYHRPKKNCYYVTSYVKLMDFLVDREEDVKELRASRIIWNCLSTDTEVAKLFNNLGSKSVEPPNDNYSNIRTAIQTHCKRKCAIWMAQVYHEHFSSPWTMVGLLAAVIVILFTAVQTWFAVNPKKS